MGRLIKTINFSPRLRMNIGKKGFSFTGNVPGLRLTVGTTRTTTTVKIPGTGIRYMNSTSNEAGSDYYSRNYSSKRELYEELSKEHAEQSNNYSAFLNQAKAAPLVLADSDFEKLLELREFDPKIYNLSYIYKDIFISEFLAKYPATKFMNFLFWASAVSALSSLAVTKESLSIVFLSLGAILFCINIFNFFKIKNGNYSLAVQAFNQYLHQIEEVKELHPQNESNRIETLKKVFLGEPELLRKSIEEVLFDFTEKSLKEAHGFEVKISFEYDRLGSLSLDLNLPELSDVIIIDSKKVLKSGEVRIKPKKTSAINKEYNIATSGISFNLAAKLFNLSPVIQCIKVRGRSRGIEASTVSKEDLCMYDVCFDRKKFSELNFENIDVLKELKNFRHRSKTEKIKKLKTIIEKKAA